MGNVLRAPCAPTAGLVVCLEAKPGSWRGPVSSHWQMEMQRRAIGYAYRCILSAD